MTSSNSASQPRASLLGLSPECRLMIYHHLFEDSKLSVDRVEPWYSRRMPHVQVNDGNLRREITQTCQLIRQESLPVLWSQTKFHIDDSAPIDKALNFNVLLQRFARHAKNVYSTSDLYYVENHDYCALFPNMKVLSIRTTLGGYGFIESLADRFACNPYQEVENRVIPVLNEELEEVVDEDETHEAFLNRDRCLPPNCQVMFDMDFQIDEETEPSVRVLIDYTKQKVLDIQIDYPPLPPADSFFGPFSVDDFDLLSGGVFDDMAKWDVLPDEPCDIESCFSGETDLWGWPTWTEWRDW